LFTFLFDRKFLPKTGFLHDPVSNASVGSHKMTSANMRVLVLGTPWQMLAGFCVASLKQGHFIVAQKLCNGSGRAELKPVLGNVAFLSILDRNVAGRSTIHLLPNK